MWVMLVHGLHRITDLAWTWDGANAIDYEQIRHTDRKCNADGGADTPEESAALESVVMLSPAAPGGGSHR